MTETNPTSPAPRVCSSRKSRWLWRLIAAALLLGIGAAAGVYVLGLTAVAPEPQPAPEIAALERRLDTLESRPAIQSEAPLAPVGTADLEATVKNLETQLVQDEAHEKQERQVLQKRIAAILAFGDLRTVVQSGRSFAPQVAALRAALTGDAEMAEPLAKIELFSSTSAPTLPQLREALANENTPDPTPVALDGVPSWWARLKAIFQPLVSVHPLHNASYPTVEKALDSGDAEAALEAVKALPDAAQKSLAAWQTKLEARIALDKAMQALAEHFSTPMATQGDAP